jgi:hypothetical protein
MRLYILANTTFNIPPSILLGTIKELATHIGNQQSYKLYVIGSDLPASLVSFCNDIESITTLTSNEAKLILKNDKAASIIHFGADFEVAKEAKIYFIPLATTAEMVGGSWVQRLFLKTRYEKWIQQSHKVLCFNDWSFKSFSEKYSKFNEKIISTYYPSLNLESFEWHELSLSKEKLTSGNQYFLCFAPLDRFIAILKEFSIFKKWQQTTIHLVFVVDTMEAKDKALTYLMGYKFRQSITLITVAEIELENLAASYVILFEGVSFSKSTWVQQAIQFEVPLLFDQALNLPETWIKAGEYFSFSENAALSNHFKLYYKDEIYRQSRAKMGAEWLTALHQNQLQNESIAIHNILQNNS